MSSVRVKICGIRSLKDAFMAIEEGADSLGFVFATSPRQLSADEVLAITSKIPPFVSVTGVFVNEKKERVLDIAAKSLLDTLQFHGEEDEVYCRFFEGFRVIKAFGASHSLDYEKVSRYPADAFLLDTKYKDKKGGGGMTFNWKLALPFSGKKHPLILAGGLTPGNIFSALEAVNPYAVDVSSGVESVGIKDRKKVRAFLDEVRRFNILRRNDCE